ncbi:MAG: hypothetical protein MJ106_02765 [Lentisphaeria bacterium]|nr:hypothetical protein [Lentisphaeria bacterium]
MSENIFVKHTKNNPKRHQYEYRHAKCSGSTDLPMPSDTRLASAAVKNRQKFLASPCR